MFGRGRIKDGVRDQAKVLELGPTERGARQTAKRDVEVDGRRVEHIEQLPALKAPLIGDVLPVTVGSDRLRIEWAEVPDIADRARASAAAARAGDSAGAAAALGFTVRDEQK
jgi:hypothetical protein